jgi:hypothetical protein
MFYTFTEALPHSTKELAIIWEVETALAAVLTEALESGMLIRTPALQTQTRAVLRNRISSSEMLRECYEELRFMWRNAVKSLETTVLRLGDPSEKDSLKRDLRPNQESILSQVKQDKDFAGYLKASTRTRADHRAQS